MFNRGALTDQILAHLRSATSVPIGDHLAPDEGGWSTGQPNVGEFTAYAVLVSGGVLVTPTGLCTLCFDHRATYTVRTFGALRVQTDQIAQIIREAFLSCPVQEIGSYKSRLFWCNQIGAVERINSNDPAAWRESDTFTVEGYTK